VKNRIQLLQWMYDHRDVIKGVVGLLLTIFFDGARAHLNNANRLN